jgi:hypothetical protein
MLLMLFGALPLPLRSPSRSRKLHVARACDGVMHLGQLHPENRVGALELRDAVLHRFRTPPLLLALCLKKVDTPLQLRGTALSL